MAAQQASSRSATPESHEGAIRLSDLPSKQAPITSGINLPPIIKMIASDRFGYCLYECEIEAEDSCGAAMAKSRQAVLEAQKSIWDKLRRLLASILFTYVIGLAEYEEIHVPGNSLEFATSPVRVLLRGTYTNDHLQLAWSYPLGDCGAFCSSIGGREARSISPQGRPMAILVRRRLSRLRTALFTSVIMLIGLLISYGVGSELGWQVGFGVVAAMYAFITAVQASVWLIEKCLGGVLT